METGEYTSRDNGIKYVYRFGHFQRIDDKDCYIKYEINNYARPVSVFIQSWKCFTTEPVGSGRILMKDLFTFMKEKYNDRIDDNTVVSLIPIPDAVENPRITKNRIKLEKYYKSINFDNEFIYEGSKWLSGTIGNIIQGITYYRKIGGKIGGKTGGKSRKGKKGKKSKKTRKSKKSRKL
jgi:hypothetical protein